MKINPLYVDRIEQAIAEGYITRGKWREKKDGRELLCLYAAACPDCADSTANCPADFAQQWFAGLLPWYNDVDLNGPVEEWLARLHDMVSALRRLTRMEINWDRLWYRFLRACVTEAVSHTAEPLSVTACNAVIALLDRAIAGDIPTAAEWAAVARVGAVAEAEAGAAAVRSAEAAARAAIEAEAEAEAAAAAAAEAEAEAAAAAAAAEAEAWAAASAAAAEAEAEAAAAEAEAWAAASAASSAASLRLCSALIAAMNLEADHAEANKT